MAYQNEKQNSAAEEKERSLRTDNDGKGTAFSDIPNCVMGDNLFMAPPPGTPNCVMRELADQQISAAEEEADRLSGGIASGTPDFVRREMGSRLGSDFSSVRFHSGPESIRKSDSMGARAFTRGSDVWFGRGGFEPSVAAHELVHTVQQGAVSGHVDRSVSYGTVQRISLFRRIRNFFTGNRAREDDPVDELAREDAGMDRVAPGVYVRPEANAPAAPAAGRRDQPRQNDLRPAPAAAPVRTGAGARRAARHGTKPERTQDELHNKLGKMQRYLQSRLADLAQMAADLQPLQQDLQGPQKLARMLAGDPQKLQRLLESQTKHEVQQLKKQESDLQKERPSPGRDTVLGDTGRRIGQLEAMQEFQQNHREVRPQQIDDLRQEMQDALYEIQRLQQSQAVQPGQVDGLYQRAKDLQTRFKKMRIDKNKTLVIRQENQRHLTQLQTDLPDPRTVFKLDENDREQHRWRMSSEVVDIDGMVQYYIAWCDIHGRDRGFQGDISAPIRGGLAEANAALLRLSDRANQAAAAPGGSAAAATGYHAPNGAVSGHRSRLAEADVARNAAAAINAGGKFGVMADARLNHNPVPPQNAPADYQPSEMDRWDLNKSNGDYSPYTDYVAPIAGGVLGTFGGVTGAISAGFGVYDTNRKRQNQAVGGSALDTTQSALDTAAAGASSISGFWNAAESFSGIGGSAVNMGASVGVPIINIGTGLVSAVSGGMQSERARRSLKQLDSASEELDRAQQRAGAAAPLPGEKTDQQKLQDALEHTRMVGKLNQTSGALKAAAGASSAAAGVATLAGGAPVAAAFQATAAALSIAKFAFERGYKHHMRSKVVGTHFSIDWSREMKDVRAMIKTYNSSFHLRDKDVRAIILKAHGSADITRTKAFNTIKLKRAQYLIDIANDDASPFRRTAEMVIEAMGIHKVGNSFAEGAKELLAEKLGGG